jgi:hypothetical protein
LAYVTPSFLVTSRNKQSDLWGDPALNGAFLASGLLRLHLPSAHCHPVFSREPAVCLGRSIGLLLPVLSLLSPLIGLIYAHIPDSLVHGAGTIGRSFIPLLMCYMAYGLRLPAIQLIYNFSFR